MKRNILNGALAIFLIVIYLSRDQIDAWHLQNNELFQNEIVTNSEIKTLQTENAALKKTVNLMANYPTYQISKVKYRDIYDFADSLTIYKGKAEDIQKGSFVINDEALIGVVTAVYKHTSTVRLLSNKKSNISVKINSVYGLLRCQNNKLIVSNIPNYDLLQIGDKVYTSGLGTLPENIYIGEVENITTDKLGIEKILTVKWGTNPDQINYVWVGSPK